VNRASNQLSPHFGPEIESSVRYSEMPVGFNRTARSFIPKDNFFFAFKRLQKTLLLDCKCFAILFYTEFALI
jgi:hypothetical protein